MIAILLGFVSGYLSSELYKSSKAQVPSQKLRSNLTNHESLADRLFDEVRVACLVMTQPKTHTSRGEPVLESWGYKCNKLVFMSTIEARTNDTLGVVALPVPEGKNHLWLKAKEMLKYAYYNLMDEVDWFYKCDDDT